MFKQQHAYKFNIQNCKCSDYTARLPFWSTENTHKVATKTIPYERYGEILFQKVALCYLLHFVQDGCSKNVLEKCVYPRTNVYQMKVGKTTVHISP